MDQKTGENYRYNVGANHGAAGGHARARNMSKEAQSAHGRKAVAARWARFRAAQQQLQSETVESRQEIPAT